MRLDDLVRDLATPPYLSRHPMPLRPTADSELAVGCLMGLHHTEDTIMATRMERQPRRRSVQPWPQSGVQEYFDMAHSHIDRARRFIAVCDFRYAQMCLADAAHAHDLARQLLRGIRA